MIVLATVVTKARAQTNIDQGKSPAEIFANTCAACHKSIRGLANGQNSLTLPSFLQEHYTASRDQARALAAYVLASGGGGPAPQPPGQKPNARAALEEPKNGERAPKGEPKTAARPQHPAAKLEEAPAAAKLEAPKEEEAKPRAEPSPASSTPGITVGTREPLPALAAPALPQGPTQGTASTPPIGQPAAAPTLPSELSATPRVPDADLNPAPSTTAAGEAEPADSAPVPRDNIPD